MKTIVWISTLALIAQILFPAHCFTQDSEPNASKTQVWESQTSGTEESFRGLHVLSNKTVWASGTSGTVIRTTDAGKNWTVFKVPGAEKLDFRDIHAFDANAAVIISAGAPARVYRTTDTGKTWTKTFEHKSEKAFFDAMSFWDDKNGIAMSDPIDDRVLLISTNDGGKTWSELPAANRPKVIPGEGGFAASGTNMRVIGGQTVLIALGAAKKDELFKESRIVRSADRGKTWTVSTAPIARSTAGGIFTMCFIDEKNGVVVGGDYLKPNENKDISAITNDGGKTWTASNTFPAGYRSGLAARKMDGKTQLVTVGTNGTDVSDDLGKTWQKVSDTGYHAVQFAADGTGWATGGKGTVAKWIGKKTNAKK